MAFASAMIGRVLALQKHTDAKDYAWEAANVVVALYGYQPAIISGLAETLRLADLFSQAANLTALWVRESVRQCTDTDCVDGLVQISEDLRRTGERHLIQLASALDALSAGLVLCSPDLVDMKKSLEDNPAFDPQLVQALRTTEPLERRHDDLNRLRSTILEALAQLPAVDSTLPLQSGGPVPSGP